jgi:hypothetical protein
VNAQGGKQTTAINNSRQLDTAKKSINSAPRRVKQRRPQFHVKVKRGPAHHLAASRLVREIRAPSKVQKIALAHSAHLQALSLLRYVK